MSRDPFSLLDYDPLDRLLGPNPRPPAAFPPLPPAEQASFTQQALDNALSGLAFVGSTLDKALGGRAVRGVLSGRPHELLSAIPFSDTLGITRPQDAVSGEQLLQHHGLLGQNDPESWELRDLAGPAAEILLDPGTYLTFGGSALTKAGRAAKLAGTLQKGLKGVEAGQRGLVRIGLPFSEAGAVLGTGPQAANAVRAVGKAADLIPGVKPLKWAAGKVDEKVIRPLFDTTAGRSFDRVTQEANREFGVPAERAVREGGRRLEFDLRGRLHPILKASPDLAEPLYAAIRRGAENVPQSLPPELAPSSGAVSDVASRIHAAGKDILASERAMGLPTRDAADLYADYVLRRAEAGPKAGGESHKLWQVAGASDIRRKQALRDVPGGTEQLRAWTKDPDLTGAGRTLSPQAVRARLLNDMAAHAQAAGQQITPDVLKALQKKARALEGWLGDLDPKYAAPGSTGLFNPDVIADTEARFARSATKQRGAASLYGLLGRHARRGAGEVPVPDFLKRVGLQTHGDWVALEPAQLQALRGLGIRDADAGRDLLRAARAGDPAAKQAVKQIPKDLRQALTARNTYGANLKALESLAPRGARTLQALQQAAPAYAQAQGLHPATALNRLIGEELARFALPEPVVASANRYMNAWRIPHDLGPLVEHGIDRPLNLFKGMVYPMFPASQVRNVASAAYNNLVHAGVLPFGPEYRAASQALREGRIADDILPGLSHLSPEERAAAVLREAHAQGNILEGISADELMGGTPGLNPLADKYPGAPRGGSLAADVLGAFQPRTLEFGRQPGAWNPLNIAGVRTEKDVFAPVAAARVGAGNAEALMRLAPFIAQLRKGATPQVAGDLVRQIHFPYDRLTDFERHVMKRLAPFYTYTKFNLPLQLRTLAQEPAKIGLPARALLGARGEGYVPQYLSSGGAIPVGKEEGGQQRYITSLGLPMEEAFEKLRFHRGLPDLQQTAQRYAGMLNPQIKLPAELMTGVQLHTGRRLEDLRPTRAGTLFGALDEDSGRARLLTELLANTPATRFLSTIDKLTDTRKGWLPTLLNLGTGFKVSDVDVEKSRSIDARREVERLLAADPAVSRMLDFYVRPEDRARLSPEDVRTMRAFAAAKEEASRAARSRRLRAATGR